MANIIEKDVSFIADVPGYASFPYLWTPRKNEDGTPGKTYEVTCCFNKNSKKFQDRFALMQQLALSTLRAKFGEKANFGPGRFRSPFRDGDADFDLDKYPNYEGKVIVPMRSYGSPVDVKDVNGNFLNSEDVYAGCVIIPSFGFYAYDKGTNKGVSGALRAVFKLADSTPWVARASADKDFAGINPQDYADEFDVDNSAMFGGMADV